MRDWFDAGGGSDETFGDQSVFGLAVEVGDDALVERALNLLSPWSRFRSSLAIGIAIRSDNAGLLKNILDAGATPTAGRGELSNIAKAAEHNAFSCVDVLLDHGLSIDDRGGLDLTPLHWAAKTGNERAAAFLLERGADPQAITTSHDLTKRDKEPNTALEIARKHDRTGVVRLLAAAAEGEPPAQPEIDPGRVRAAVAAVRERPFAGAAWFGHDIPADELRTAVANFAPVAVDEEALVLVPSLASGKAGFLLTDRALYFQEALGSKRVSMPYGEIERLSRDRRHLRLSTAAESLEWDLTETLLWEKSRKKAAEVVVAILQEFLGPQPESAATAGGKEKPGVAAAPDVTESGAVSVEIEAPVDWPAVIAFHAPIVLLGIPLIMPAAFALIAASGLGGEGLSRGIGRLDYVQLLTLGAMSLGPSIFAFGTRLQFSFGRYLPAVALVAFASIQALTTAMRVGTGAVPITFGGGLLGIVVAGALGAAGLSIFRRFRRPENSP